MVQFYNYVQYFKMLFSNVSIKFLVICNCSGYSLDILQEVMKLAYVEH